MTTTPPTPADPGVSWNFTYRCGNCRELVQVTDGRDPHQPCCPPPTRPRTIEIKGVWLIKDTAHTGNGIQVVVELPDGTLREAIVETADDGPISHYVHPSGILHGRRLEFGA